MAKIAVFANKLGRSNTKIISVLHYHAYDQLIRNIFRPIQSRIMSGLFLHMSRQFLLRQFQ